MRKWHKGQLEYGSELTKGGMEKEKKANRTGKAMIAAAEMPFGLLSVETRWSWRKRAPPDRDHGERAEGFVGLAAQRGSHEGAGPTRPSPR